MESTGAAKKTASVAVGHIFFGQFVDHDVTLDLTSSFARLDRPEDTTNFRTPTLDLDCIYGDGHEGSPFMYWNFPKSNVAHKFNGIKLLVGADMPGATVEQQQDLFRSPHGRAVIGDPRNDENRIISQLQLGIIRFHNKVVDALDAKNVPGQILFAEARRVVTWHYQWTVVNDFLRTIVGNALVDDILGNGRKIYRPENCGFGPHYGASPFIPVEFSVAGYRFGHSMIPQRIQIQAGNPAVDLFGPSLGFGFSPLPNLQSVVQWPQLLDLTNATVDRCDKLDALMAKDLLNLPFVDSGEKSLAVRNLLRGQAFRLPSGESVAAKCGRLNTEIAKVSAKAKTLDNTVDLSSGTPLWLYILLEAGEIGRETTPGQFDKGEGLGPTGGRIVAETIIGLLELDPASFLGSDRSWSPARPEDKLSGGSGLFSLLDILTY